MTEKVLNNEQAILDALNAASQSRNKNERVVLEVNFATKNVLHVRASVGAGLVEEKGVHILQGRAVSWFVLNNSGDLMQVQMAIKSLRDNRPPWFTEHGRNRTTFVYKRIT